MSKLTIHDRAERTLDQVAEYLAQDAHTCEPPLSWSDCVYMASDCYLEMHGQDREAAKYFRSLPENDQDKILKKLARRESRNQKK